MERREDSFSLDGDAKRDDDDRVQEERKLIYQEQDDIHLQLIVASNTFAYTTIPIHKAKEKEEKGNDAEEEQPKKS